MSAAEILREIGLAIGAGAFSVAAIAAISGHGARLLTWRRGRTAW